MEIGPSGALGAIRDIKISWIKIELPFEVMMELLRKSGLEPEDDKNVHIITAFPNTKITVRETIEEAQKTKVDEVYFVILDLDEIRTVVGSFPDKEFLRQILAYSA